ncbi:hypothetical protein HYU07_01930 [Candidatus Woesearchaeota archaeon]|nr:hypothetical protein [Candidatus Woesearchaeota archaeon]
MMEVINPYIVKILITARDNDSIRVISKRIDLSYAWTYNWMQKLVDLGIIERKGQKIKIDKENAFYREFVAFIKKVLKERLSLADAYSLPNLTGLDYAFTATDAVFIWTKGGYNIGRSKDRYPIFIEILEEDLGKWCRFFDKFSVRYSRRVERKKGIYFILIVKKKIEKEFVNGVFVVPLKETIEYARKYIYNFEPALEMLDQMYGLNMKIKYAEKEMM